MSAVGSLLGSAFVRPHFIPYPIPGITPDSCLPLPDSLEKTSNPTVGPAHTVRFCRLIEKSVSPEIGCSPVICNACNRKESGSDFITVSRRALSLKYHRNGF